jgi:chemotaxis protein histidine kinase CheA
MNNDALERLKNKNRPVVENRDTSLDFVSSSTSTSTNQDISMSGLLDNEASRMLGIAIAGGNETKNSNDADIEASSQAQATQITQASNSKPAAKHELETKQSTLRLEAKLSDRLQALCREQGICREVLIEAMFEYCEENSEVLSGVLAQAGEKNDYRQEIANRRRAKSMMEKFGGGVR